MLNNFNRDSWMTKILLISLFLILAGCNSGFRANSILSANQAPLTSVTPPSPTPTSSPRQNAGDFSNLRIAFQGTGATVVSIEPEAIFRHHSGDSPLLAVIGKDPANDGPSLQFEISDSDATNATSITLVNTDTNTTIASGTCSQTGNNGGPICTVLPSGSSFYETKSCSGGTITGPIAGHYAVNVGYSNGTVTTSTVIFPDSCSISSFPNTVGSASTGFQNLMVSFQGTGAAVVNSTPETLFTLHDGDSPLLADLGQSPANGGPGLTFAVTGSDASGGITMNIANLSTGTIWTGHCSATGNSGQPICSVTPYEGPNQTGPPSIFGTKACSGGLVTAPVPANYKINVIYTGGAVKSSTVTFPDPCSVFVVAANHRVNPNRSIASVPGNSETHFNYLLWIISALGLALAFVLGRDLLLKNFKNK
jgi:hypothetical protein